MKTMHSQFSSSMKAAAWAMLGSLLLVIAIACRQPLEQTMARHMLVQIPMLLIAGVSLNRFLARLPGLRTIARHAGSWDEYGLTGLAVFLLASAYWMIPKALDSAVASGLMETGKFASLLVAGFVLPASLSRANTILQLFFLGNFASMMAIAGMLFQDTSTRLCNFYLLDDQVLAGTGLVTLAVVIPVLWCLGQASVREFFRGGQQAAPEVVKVGHP